MLTRYLLAMSGMLASALLLQPAAALANSESARPLRISGYVQARFVEQQDSTHTHPDDGFTVRRGRLKATYATDWAAVVLQIDAMSRGMLLRDAYAELFEPWSGKKFSLIMGQTIWPFGYEPAQSSGVRELPERSRVIRALARSERDRGAKVVGKVGALVFSGGVFDGNGIDYAGFSGKDNDKYKDVVGRVGFDLQWLTGGISGWHGKTVATAANLGASNAALLNRTFKRTRLGADVQLYLHVLPWGCTAIKGEWVMGETWLNSQGVEQLGKKAVGGYGALIQNLGDRDVLAVRYDYFDGDRLTDNQADAAQPTRPATMNAINTYGFAWVHQWDEALKITLAYEIVKTMLAQSATDPHDNIFTVQMLAKF